MVSAVAVIDAPAQARPSGSCSVDIVTGTDAFLALEGEWNETVERAGIAHPFLRHEWVRTWWDAFGSGAALHIVIVRDAGRITAIAPMMSETTRMYGMPVRRLRLVHNDHTPRADFIIAGQPDAAYRAIWGALRQTTWDVLQFGQLAQPSETTRALEALATASGCRVGHWQSGDAPFLELTGTWDQYFSGRPAKFRQNLRNRMSRLTRVGEPVLETLTDADAILAARDDAFRLEASGWKQEAGTAVDADPDVRRFYALLAERGSARGWLRLWFLTVNGRRIAVSYGAQYANRLFLFKTGYDPAYAQYSPFKLLTYFALRQAYSDGLREFDFLGETEPWKLEWTAATRPHDWLFVFGDTSRARLLHHAKFQIAPALKRWRG
jgi:CelD/BcsL family acetyltransferase involved in cellulose biosynthesis